MVNLLLLGLWGLILGPLLVAAARDIVKYFVVEWNRLETVPKAANVLDPPLEQSAEVGTTAGNEAGALSGEP